MTGAPEDGLLAAVAAYQEAAAELRRLIREGREVIQETRELRREMDTHVAQTIKGLNRALSKKVNELIEQHLNALNEELVPFREQVLAKIDEHWRNYSDILLGRARETRRPGQHSIDEIAGMIASQATHPGLPSVIGNIPEAFDPKPVFQRATRSPRGGGSR